MEKLFVEGGARLVGRVRVSSAKNAVLPIIAATMLPMTPSLLPDVPALEDVGTICEVLKALGVKVDVREDGIRFDAAEITDFHAPDEWVGRMRASFLVMGPLLARVGRARIALPGGCAIGTRPVDLHLKAFAALGADIKVEAGHVEAVAKDGLKGAPIYLDFPSVGATENALMAAVLATGKTVIENAAKEPEIVDLCTFLNSMGANIRGAGTDMIRVEGVEVLSGVVHNVIPDRIEGGTFMVGAAMTAGDVYIENLIAEHVTPLIAKLHEMGATVEEDVAGIRVIGPERLRSVNIKTLPYPGFPTDMQAQWMAMLTVANGTGSVTETVFENRFMHVAELIRMGADISVNGRKATIRGVKQLTGCAVEATDLRAGAAMVLAGLVASGTTEIGALHHIDRGYHRLVDKMKGLGANIVRA